MPPPKKKQNKKSLLPSRVMKEKIHTIKLSYIGKFWRQGFIISLWIFFYTLSTCKYVLSITIRKILDFLLLTIHVHLFDTHMQLLLQELESFFISQFDLFTTYLSELLYLYIYQDFVEPLWVKVWTGFWLFLIQRFC